jgi:hypothetical protein
MCGTYRSPQLQRHGHLLAWTKRLLDGPENTLALGETLVCSGTSKVYVYERTSTRATLHYKIERETMYVDRVSTWLKWNLVDPIHGIEVGTTILVTNKRQGGAGK